MSVSVQTTQLLKQLFQEANTNLIEFCDLFAQWKSLGPAGEDEVYEFGKDVAYARPCVNGVPHVLRHVHLVPLVDLTQKTRWDRQWERHSRRTSNRALVYVDNDRDGFLLLDIIPEPDAHDIPQMLTKEHQQIMDFYAQIAEKFIYFNQIIA